MKLRFCLLTLVGLIASSVAFAQDTPPAGDTGAPASSATANNTDPVQPEVTADPAPINPPAADPPADGSAPAAQANPPAQPGAVIPLIVMDDVPLTDAIKNLARQAGLNYMLDPKVQFGQVGGDGKVVPQPLVSIRWENVTAEQALNALLGNYNLQLVEDPKSKIARVTVKDPAAPDPLVTKIIQLKYASPTNIMTAVQNILGARSKVVADIRTSQLVVLATEKEMNEVDILIEELDKITRQVLIEARLLETSMNPSTAKGVDWAGTLEEQKVTFGNYPIGQLLHMSPSEGSFFNPVTTFLNADGVRLALSFLNKYAEAKVISTPRTVTLDNEMAKIEVTRANPIINVTAGTANTTGGSQTMYTNLGVILNVTPRISANNYVNLKVMPEVSRVFDTVKRELGEQGTYEADRYDIRKMETRVMIPSGNTLVMGGLVQDDIRSGNSKVPLLGDIPGFGYLFRRDTKSREKSNLIVFITPTIVDDSDYQPTKSDFMKTPVPTEDTLEPDWSWWDSGKPADWKSTKEEPRFAELPPEPADTVERPSLADIQQ